MRTLYFTPGSPFSRGVRIVLHEKNLPFERAETIFTPSVEERARVTPTLQVPILVDGAITLWDSAVGASTDACGAAPAAAPASALRRTFDAILGTWGDWIYRCRGTDPWPVYWDRNEVRPALVFVMN